MKFCQILFIICTGISLSAGIHVSKAGIPFKFGSPVITAPAEFSAGAKLLQDVLQKICKRNIPLAPGGNIIFEKNLKLPPQGFTITTTNNAISLAAADPDGAKFAAARLCRELGYRWFFPTPEWEIVPEKLPEVIALDLTESPDYISRRIWSGWGIWRDYKKATDDDALWNTLNFQGGEKIRCGHVYGSFIMRRKKVFEAHPEYYGLLKGRRISNKLCISNPGLRKLFIDYQLELLKKNPLLNSISAEPSDGGNWCECNECNKLGSPSNRAVLLANETARAVTAQYPNVKVGMYAYNQHCTAPDIDLHPAVVVNIATAFIKGGHSTDSLINSWRKRKANIGIREYYFIKTTPGNGKGTDSRHIAASLRHFYQKGANYITAESSDAWGAGGFSRYAGCHLMWNTAAPLQELYNDFLQKSFPHSLEVMTQFYALLDGSSPRPLNSDLLGRMYRLLDTALKKAEGMEKKRIYQLAGYTRFCELLFKLQQTGKWNDYVALLNFGAAIRPYRMVHSYAMHRDRRSLCPRGMIKKPLDIKWFSTPQPTAAELDRIIASGIANNKLLDFRPREFSSDLKLLSLPAPAKPVKTGASRRRFVYYLWSDGKPFTINVTGGLIAHYRDRGNVLLELIQIGGPSDTGELETLIQSDRSTPPDGKSRAVTFVPKHPGLHKLVVNDGGDMTAIKWPEKLPAAVPVESESSPGIKGNYYFYVPTGTETLGFYAKTTRGTIITPDGKIFRKLDKSNGFYSQKIPPALCGKVWELRNVSGVIKLLTVPSTLSILSNRILIPQEVK